MTKQDNKTKVNVMIDTDQYLLFKKSAEIIKKTSGQNMSFTGFVNSALEEWNNSWGKAFIENDTEILKQYYNKMIDDINCYKEKQQD